MNQSQDTEHLERIAVIGIAGRFPGAANTEQYWENLCKGIESVARFSDEQLLTAGAEPALLSDPSYVKAGVVLDGVELFDASFFGFSPREAELMDPQHRVFLECAWEALEDAGHVPDSGQGRVGVFAGAGLNTYFLLNITSDRGLMDSWSDLQRMMVIDKDYLATRASYKLNLKGPSITVQTACSTSLVAVHLACQSLLNGECDMALAGGVSIRIPQIAGYRYEEGSIQSPDGHCRAFDADAGGMVLGSGAGIVILRRLEDAVADGDCIRAVIRSSSINNDGADKVGYTAPSVEAQASVIAETHALAGVSAAEVSYVETHGTGTRLGDPIEIAALTKAFRRTTDKTGFCAIGSVKTNIGHLDAAAGVAGLIKVVLALEKGMLPPSLNFNRPNPNIDFAQSPFVVQKTLSGWRRGSSRRLAGVSSFGIGGTNAHVLLEEAPEVVSYESRRPWHLLTLSARTPGAVEKITDNLANFLAGHAEVDMADVAFTLQSGRKGFEHRRSVAVCGRADAIEVLRSRSPKRVFTHSQGLSNATVAFMFPGQAAQCVNMGLEIYRVEKGFRETVDYCCELLKPALGIDLLEVLYPSADRAESAAEQINQTAITQPALFTIEYAMARLWMEWGVVPESMIGHSIGEYVAACLAGAFSLEDALALVAVRGRLMNSMPRGSMLAVRADENMLRQYLDGDLSVAAINGPATCVVSGPSGAIAALQQRLEHEKIGCRLLRTSHAFHSSMMEPALPPFRKAFGGMELKPPNIPFISNLTGTWIEPARATDPGYWADHLRGTVRFSDGLGQLMKNSDRVLLEVGPGQTLTSFSRQHPAKTPGQVALASFGFGKERTSDLEGMIATLGQLWALGAKVSWPALHGDQRRRRVPLPTYPFERRRYWIDGILGGGNGQARSASEHSRAGDGSGYCGTERSAEQPQIAAAVYDRPSLTNEYSAPEDDLEVQLAAIWQELLGIKSIGTQDDFFELGGQSLLAAGLFAQIERRLHRKIPLATIFEAPTIRQLAGIMRQGGWKPNWASLVAIQPNGSRPPLFLVHGAEGNVLLYRELVDRLGPDQPVYGLQSRGLDGTLEIPTRLEDMAACYIEEIRNRQPEGPYYLGGYCMGGGVALEMAQQLLAQGQDVALVAMFETNNLTGKRKVFSFPYRLYHSIQNIKFHMDNLWLARSSGGFAFFKEKLRVQKTRARVAVQVWLSKMAHGFRADAESAYPHLFVTKVNDQAFIQYVPRKYAGRITVFRARKNFAGLDNPQLGWSGMAEGGVDVHVLPVKPRGMLVEPFVRLLAEELRTCIQEAVAKRQ
jgi:phthiocerol/phenolphthiocerol synthesis type-I polyketide synthase E